MELVEKQKKLEKLNGLRQKRIALAAQVEELRMRIHHFQGGTLRSRLLKKVGAAPPRTVKATTSTEDRSDPRSNQQFMMPLEMRSIRQRQCLAATYRLSGISVVRLPSDPNILAVRLDVLSACYQCFFDVVTMEQQNIHDAGPKCSGIKNKKYNEDSQISSTDGMHSFLRLVQHTLPSVIPLSAILQRHLGGIDGMAELATAWPEECLLLDKLRGCVNEIYHACFCWTVRNETVQYLEGLAAAAAAASRHDQHSTESSGAPQPDYSLDQLRVYSSSTSATKPQNHVSHQQCSTTGGSGSSNFTISFQLHHRLSGISVVTVTLQYPSDLCRPRAHQPLQVTVRTGSARSSTAENNSSVPRHHRPAHINNNNNNRHDGSDDDEYYDEFVEGAVLFFRRLSIREALQAVVDAMQLY